MITVTYISHMGDDLAVVNAARVSFAKQAAEFRMQDAKLLGFLARNGHWTPFAHPQISVHVAAPIFVARQCFKHKVGFVENEVSRRYVDSEPAFYHPQRWRGRADDRKQGSSNVEIIGVELEEREIASPTLLAEDCYRTCLSTYNAMIRAGVAPELARMVLPQAMMTEWIWTGSLAAFARFAALRQADDAQEETGQVAWLCADILEQCFPVSWAALVGAEVALQQTGDAA